MSQDSDLIGEFSARVWAERFVQRVTENPAIATDEGTMLAWFSGAIMAGYDHRDAKPKAFEFHREHDGSLSVESAVFQALGAASTCWENLHGTGVFDSTRAKEIGEALCAFLDTNPS